MKLNTTNKDELMLENYVTDYGLTNADAIMRAFNLSVDEMNLAIERAIDRGFRLYCVNELLFVAKTREEFEDKLIRAWNAGAIEYADRKSLTNVNKYRAGGKDR